MAFVPEGQADSSQARSAWVAMQRDPPVPEGRSKSLSVPEERAKGVGHGRIIFWHLAYYNVFL